ncbi:hypothetical protein IJX73_02255 [bacterium]|nr:hypothetical protein [bacterium]MBQ9149731.1 hypothetical protein [bacterium]
MADCKTGVFHFFAIMYDIKEIVLNVIKSVFKLDKISIGVMLMLFFIIFVTTFLFLKYTISFDFTNNQLFLIWIVSVCSLTLSLTFFFADYREWQKEQNELKKIKEHKEQKKIQDNEHFIFVLNHCSEDAKQFFKEFVMQNSETIIMDNSQHDILNYLRLRNIDVQFLGDKYYKITKEQLEIIKEYFK